MAACLSIALIGLKGVRGKRWQMKGRSKQFKGKCFCWYLDTIYRNLKLCANASVVWCSGRMTMERVCGVGIDFHYHTVVTVVPHILWPTCTAACSSWVWVMSVLQARNMLIWPEKTILICTAAEQNAVPKLLSKRRFVISMFYIQPFSQQG